MNNLPENMNTKDIYFNKTYDKNLVIKFQIIMKSCAINIITKPVYFIIKIIQQNHIRKFYIRKHFKNTI